MSCGTKIEGRFHSWAERQDLAEALERDGEHRLATAVKHGDCLDANDLFRANRALEREGLARYHDYREERCQCSAEEDF